MWKNELDELFTLYHLDMGLADEEIEDLKEESTFEQRYRWLKKFGFDCEGVLSE